MELVVRAALGFVVAAVLLGTMEALWPEDKEQPRWRADSSTDVLYWFFTLVVTKTLVGILVLIALALTMRTLPRLDTTFAAAQPAWLQALEVLLIGDFIGYWSHRWSHHAPALWRLHAIHHSPEQLD